MPETTIKLPAFAKINWSLRVIGRRQDGFHEIDTVLQTISLHDTLAFSPLEEDRIALSCSDPSLSCDERNLVWRAASALRTRMGDNIDRLKGADIRLEKRIPMQAGLGGGSSDAAAALIGLTSLWSLEISASELWEIASDLGADVPFFLWGGMARGTGTGTCVTPLADGPQEFLLVIKPNAVVSTSHAYELLNSPALTTSGTKTILSSSERNRFFDNLSTNALENDFEAVAFQLEPEIERAKTALLEARARAALLAGSGSAVFGIFDNEDAQKRAIRLIELESGWRVFPCCTVGRSHYRSAMDPCGAIFGRFTGP